MAETEQRLVRSRRIGGMVFLCLAAGVFSLLIWAKLRVVTGIPRTAYAEPENPKTLRVTPAKSEIATPE